ncbi:MAG: ABC transporter ATP-binding protein, partial [Desulfobacteraceae bacterium]
TAAKVMDLTDSMIRKNRLTALMVTHNMNQALIFGNRLIMLHVGGVILDVRGEEKKDLTIGDLLARFYEVQGEDFSLDKMLLTQP